MSRPRIIPTQKNVSHGTSGWVPWSSTSNTAARGLRIDAASPEARPLRSNHEVSAPARVRSSAHHWTVPAASALTAASSASHRMRRVNSSAAAMK